MRRKALTKKVRFEVLKRDKFTCQYCGAKAPDVLLHVDHVTPVCNGGTSDILNLISSCEPCNLGKGGRPLDDASALSKQRAQATALQARREQLEMMAEWQNNLLTLEADAVAAASQYYQRLFPGFMLNEIGLADVRSNVAKYGLEAVMATMRAFAPRLKILESGKAEAESARMVTTAMFNSLRYREYNEKDPVGSRLRYIMGIVRRRCTYHPERRILDLLREAHEAGVSLDELTESAKQASYYTHWEFEVETLIKEAGRGR